MLITPVKTAIITAGATDLLTLLDQALPEVAEGSIVAITSKIVSLCEGAVVPLDAASKPALVHQQAQYYLPATHSKYGHSFTVTNHTLISSAGIDESNGDGHYVLWPRDPQATANAVRAHLRERFGLQAVGVIITDSTCQPLRRGTIGIVLAHSGFAALHNYVGTPDLFGKPFSVSQAGVASGLAAAAVLQIGEGTEQTPLAVIADVPFVTFQDRDPTAAELAELHIPLEDDLFAPFLTAVEWRRGSGA